MASKWQIHFIEICLVKYPNMNFEGLICRPSI